MVHANEVSPSLNQAEEQGFSHFHIYVCAAFLVKWSEQLVKMDFQVRHSCNPFP